MSNNSGDHKTDGASSFVNKEGKNSIPLRCKKCNLKIFNTNIAQLVIESVLYHFLLLTIYYSMIYQKIKMKRLHIKNGGLLMIHSSLKI